MEKPKIPSFSECMKDTDGDYSQARILKTARELISEGRRPHRVQLALLRASKELANERGDFIDWIYSVRAFADMVIDNLPKIADKLEEERRKNAH